MIGRKTRRGFLRQASLASSCLVLPARAGAGGGAQVAEPAAGTAGSRLAAGGPAGTAALAPLVVVTQSVSVDRNPRARSWMYITEILRRGGLFFEQMSPAQLPSLLGRPNPVVLLAGDLPLTSSQRDLLATWVRNGGSLIGVGGCSGLDGVFGVSEKISLAEGWMKVKAAEHPVVAGLRSSLHVFGGYAVKKGSAAVVAEVAGGSQGAKGSAILENRVGKGRALLLAPDLIFSVLHMQQGLPVLQDGKAPPDDSAPINEGALKAEDGLVLDWQRDRTPMEPDGGPVFLEPISDELREIILRSIFHAAQQQDLALPMLWYWPRGLPAVGHLSHDTDGNDPQKAVAMLEVVKRCRVKSTWCTLYPGGYPKDFYRTLKDQGFEIALHYDAMAGGPETSWSKENFLLQHRWLMREAELDHIASNKNHYTRWEGRLDFFRWCQELGIRSDQTRGPSKKGTIGFPLGGSQPYFPLDDEREDPRWLNVLEVNMLTQDLVVVCPGEYGKQLVDSVLRHHGVAHFLFHPAHILKPRVADTLSGLMDYGRSQGLEWWTNGQIYEWEVLRRGVAARFASGRDFSLHAGKPVPGATLLVLRSAQQPRAIRLNGRPAASARRVAHGFEFDAVTADIAGEVTVQIA